MFKELGSALAALLLFSMAASASAVVPLDTFPSSGYPNGPDAGLFARALDGREIAVPFSISAAGRITKIETGILGPISRGGECYSLSLGILSSADLLGSFRQFGFSFPWQFYTGKTDFPCRDLYANGIEVGNEFVTLSGLSYFLEAGDYWLVASFNGDISEPRGGWLTNPDILSDEWALRLCPPGPNQPPRQGGGCDAWATLQDRDIDPSAVPAARITFEPGLRIPEPSTFTVSATILLALSALRRRRVKPS